MKGGALLALLVLASLLSALPVMADISVRAHMDRAQLEVGDSATLTVEVNGAQNAPAPALQSPDGVSLRYFGPQTQVSIVNGQMSASVTHRFSVTALKAGTFTIGPIRLEIAGKAYDAGSVTIQAVAGAAPAQPGPRAAPSGQPLRLELATSKTEVYLHERIPITLKLYVGNVRVSDVQYPTIPGDGFALEKFAEPQQRQEQTAQGVFQVVTFTTTLTPVRSGPLTVGPAKIAMNLLSKRRGGGGDPFLEQFFGGDPFAQRKPMELPSEPLQLTVLPLPEQGKPADFSGAVGRFEFAVNAAPAELQQGDPVTITMKIRGVGNFEHVTAPALNASDELKVYPVQPQAGAHEQEKVFEQVVIPQRAGTMALPPLRFSYFDPEAKQYRSVGPGAINLIVHPSAQSQTAPQIVVGAQPGAAPRVEQPLGRDIVFIKDTPGELRPIGARRYRSVWFWLYQPLPLIGWLAAVLYNRRRQRLHGDVRYARFTRAGTQAQRALAAARASLQAGNEAAFYDTAARAVSEYLAAKLDVPPGSVTPEVVRARLHVLGSNPHAADEVEAFFATCERVRFAPSAAAAGDMQRTLERADAIVRALERERRLAPRAAIAALLLAGTAATAWAAAPDTPHTLFFHANALYGNERYAEAAAEYEQVLAAGVESPHLYFNLGNAYFKAGDIGRAILNYERARRRAPGDPDIEANLSYARSVGAEADEPPIWARLLFPLAERFTGDVLWLNASALYTLLLAALALMRLVPSARRPGAWAAAAAGAALAVVLTSSAYRLITLDLPTWAVVITPNEAMVRFEPSENGTAHFAAKPGAMLRVLAQREGWMQVARGDDQRGWIETSAVATL